MKKENKFLIAIIIVGIITLAGVIFFAVKYPYIKANKNEEIIENKQEQKNDMQIVVYKNSTLKRIINKILNFLHLR